MKAYVIIDWVDYPGCSDPFPVFFGVTLSKEAAEEEIEKYYVAWENGGYHRSNCPIRIIEVELSNKMFYFDEEENEEEN
jgi:hypothetical protein